jgi:hypothetical protein
VAATAALAILAALFADAGGVSPGDERTGMAGDARRSGDRPAK